MNDGLAASGRASPAVEPVHVTRPGAVVRQTVRIRDGYRERDALCELDQTGIRISAARPIRVVWPDARAIYIDSGRVWVIAPSGSVAMTVTLDGVAEPTLTPLFARALEAGRAGALVPHAGALHELELGVDRAVERFHEADDPVVALAVGGFTALAGVILAAAIPVILEVAARVDPVPGAFAILPRISSLDPRVVVASFAGAAALAAGVGRVALGASAVTWARGTLRGWHRDAFGADRAARTTVARIMLAPRALAIVAAIAVVTVIPSAFARTVVDGDGIHGASGFPLLWRDRAWSEVTDVEPIAVGFGERAAGFDTVITFADGTLLSTRGRDLAGTSERGFYDFAKAHAR